MKRHLLDPQMYLAGLNAIQCRKTCANLASYPWFLAKGLKPYESGKQTQPEWRKDVIGRIHKIWRGQEPTEEKEIVAAIRACVTVQTIVQCEAVILPSPLTADPASDYSTELDWLDKGLEIAKAEAKTVPHYASIAISDTCLRGIPALKNDLIEAIADNVSSRKLDGAYIVLELANENGYYCTHSNTMSAFLRLVWALNAGGVKRIVVGLSGTAGLLALVAGASCWSTGWYRGQRRLRLTDFVDAGGRALPTYYSHPVATEFHLQNDLDRVTKAGLLGRVADETPASKNLLRALRDGKTVSDVADWRYTKSNVQTASEHFIRVCVRETERISDMNASELRDYGRDWIYKAEKLTTDLFKVGSFNARTELNHQQAWKKAFDEFLSYAK